MPLVKTTVGWALNHADEGPDRIYRCKKYHVPLRVRYDWRTIGTAADFPFTGLEVKRVGFVYCPCCVPYPVTAQHGEPVSIRNLINYRP